MGSSGNKHDTARLIRKIVDLGHEVIKSRNGHWKVMRPGQTPIVIPSTPSDIRSTLNTIALLRRNGIEVKA